MVVFIAWIVFIPLEQKINLNLMKKVFKSKDFCRNLMPSRKGNILEFN